MVDDGTFATVFVDKACFIPLACLCIKLSDFSVDQLLSRRHFNLHLANFIISWVVNCNYHFLVIWVTPRRTVCIRAIGTLAPLPPLRTIQLADASCRRQLLNHGCVLRHSGLDGFVGTLLVVITDMLFSCSSDTIVMLNNTNCVKHLTLALHHALKCFVWGRLSNSRHSKELIWRMHRVGSRSEIRFVVSSWSEIACPVFIWIISIGE